jgi:hypothetical protein
MHYFGVLTLRSIDSTTLDPKWCLGVFRRISLTLSIYKDAILVFQGWMHYFGAPKLRSIYSSTLDTKWCLVVFQSFSLTFSTYKDAILVFRAWMHYFGVPKLWCIYSTLVDPKWCLGVFDTISITFGHKRRKTCVSSMNALFWGTEVGKHPLYSIRPKILFASVLYHFSNLRM